MMSLGQKLLLTYSGKMTLVVLQVLPQWTENTVPIVSVSRIRLIKTFSCVAPEFVQPAVPLLRF